MPYSLSKGELALWSLLAVGAGCIVGWIDLSATDVQGPVLLLMVASFVLTVPGRAPALLVGVLCGVGVPLVHLAITPGDWTPMLFMALAPSFVGAFGGRVAGSLLGSATAALRDAPKLRTAPAPWIYACARPACCWPRC